MPAPNIPLNIPQRYSKILIVHFGCMVVPFYKCDTAAPEGAPVVLESDMETVKPATPGSASSGVIGLLAQEVYDASQLGVLANYEFHNNTRARTGDTVGVVTGKGYVLTKNYTGTVNKGDKLYPGPSGTLTATRTGSDMVCAVAEESGSDGATLIRARIDFDLVS